MVFIIHGTPIGNNPRRVIGALLEMGLELGKDFIVQQPNDLKDWKGALKVPEWRKQQPFGLMPWLEDTETGFIVYESRAICKYVAAKIGSPLLPLPHTADLETYALFEQACSAELTNIEEPSRLIFWEVIVAPENGSEPNSAYVAKLKARLALRLQEYETILSKHKYLAGDQITLADMFALPYGTGAANLDHAPALKDGSLPNVARWWKEMSSRPSWTRTLELKAEADAAREAQLAAAMQ